MKFAYMIMAHDEPYVLDKLIKMLDYPSNDIYVHIDAKSTEIDEDNLHVNLANLIMIPSQNVAWGGSSQIYVILRLLEIALQTPHDYYHLISGVDMPIRTNADMLDFFSKNRGKEFIGITPRWAEEPSIAQRYQLHWMFQDFIGKNKNFLYCASRIITKTEKLLGYKRKERETVQFYGGPGWFSVTEEAAKLILDNGEWAKSRFKNTICCDEIYAQTIIGNSHLHARIYNCDSGDSYAECLRFLRFNKESPFVLSMKDYDSIVGSGYLFARKFGTKTAEEKELVDAIYDLYK